MGTSSVLQNPSPADAYKLLYDSLGNAYWEASDISAKDQVYGAQKEVGEILTAINEQQLADNTALFAKMGAKILATNAALKKIQADIDQITKNISTAAKVTGAIAAVLSMFP